MGQSFFVWKGIDCRAMGVRMRGPAPIIRPEERVSHITIPGRSGDLTQLEGTDIYNSYIQTVTIMAHGANRMGKAIYDWLRGESYVTFSGEPDKRQKARIIGAITLDRHSYNLDWWEGEVQFYCQPLKEKLRNPTVEITTSGDTIRNEGDVISRPQMIVTTSSTSFTVTVAGDGTPAENSITVTGITSGTRYIVDSDTLEVTKRSNGALHTKDSSGAFPVLAVGTNTITGSGWSKIEIDKRERFL